MAVRIIAETAFRIQLFVLRFDRVTDTRWMSRIVKSFRPLTRDEMMVIARSA